jgi:AraC-like DNA-binding protein
LPSTNVLYAVRIDAEFAYLKLRSVPRQKPPYPRARLSESGEPIRSIAAEVGYADPFHFSRDFSKVVGVSPRQYLQQQQAKGMSG